MRVETVELAGDSAGTRRTIAVHRYGVQGGTPKVYIQAGLHADEMPGMLLVQHLLPLLDAAEAAGRISGEVLVVPVANPIGLAQWTFHRPFGRFETESMENFNRNYPDLAELAGDSLEARLTASADENLVVIRQAFRAAVAAAEARTDLQQQRLALLQWSCDADYVLDLHCDHEAVMHLYAAPARPADTALLARCTGSKLALICEVSGGHAFDEAHSAPWAALKRRFGERFPIPDGCFSTTLEYRGQLNVDDATAAADAGNLFSFLGQIRAIGGPVEAPGHDEPPIWPLAGYLEVFAPQGGVISWQAAPGDWVKAGDILCRVTDPATRKRVDLTAPIDGMMFRRELWRQCLRGQGLCHVAGPAPLRSGHLLSD